MSSTVRAIGRTSRAPHSSQSCAVVVSPSPGGSSSAETSQLSRIAGNRSMLNSASSSTPASTNRQPRKRQASPNCRPGERFLGGFARSLATRSARFSHMRSNFSVHAVASSAGDGSGRSAVSSGRTLPSSNSGVIQLNVSRDSGPAAASLTTSSPDDPPSGSAAPSGFTICEGIGSSLMSVPPRPGPRAGPTLSNLSALPAPCTALPPSAPPRVVLKRSSSLRAAPIVA